MSPTLHPQHQQAREWIQMQLDGQLDETNASLLTEHLHNCADCRAYAARFAQLDSNLKHAFRERVLIHPLPADNAIHRQMRLKMKRTQIAKLATSLVFIAVMAVAIIGFTWLVSTRGRVIFPGTGAGSGPVLTSTPIPTPTPVPWTENQPSTSLAQITAALDTLADRNVEAFQQANWVHVVRQDQSPSGTVRSFYSDSWTHYPEDDQSCAESVNWMKDNPAYSNEFLQILVGTSDGLFGDLVQLRNGGGEVTRMEPGYYSCSLTHEFPSAGQLAVRLREEQAASGNKPIDVKAWYAAPDGHSVLVVSVTFTQPSQANAIGISKERRSFDLETGALVQEGIRMEWPDGSLFAETLQGYETAFFAELPAEIAEQYEQLSNELRTYATGAALRPTQTRVPETSPVPVVEDEQFIPEADPLTDGQTILRILQALKQRQIERLSEPGWYVYGPRTLNPNNWMSNYYLLTHTVDQHGACDFMSYYVKDGRILPAQLILADGRWGMVSVLGGGQVTPGKAGEINWNDGTVTATCELPNIDTIFYIQNEIDNFQGLVNGTTKGTYKLWTEGRTGGRRFVVLYYEMLVNGASTANDPDTRKLEPIDRSESWVYFDPDWGAVVLEAGQAVFHLQNGKTIGSPPSPDKTIDAGFLYHKELPPNLKEVYEKTVADLEKQQ